MQKKMGGGWARFGGPVPPGLNLEQPLRNEVSHKHAHDIGATFSGDSFWYVCQKQI